MPELPEVETTRRGIASHLMGRQISAVTVRQPQLRYPVPADLAQHLCGQTIVSIRRRAKYLLFDFTEGALLIHLGMSGSLRVLPSDAPLLKHDHIDIVCGEVLLRLNDPRRFGCVLWLAEPVAAHPLLTHLGPEPLNADFHTEYLFAATRNSRTPIKLWIMDASHVVGVGNIYASESLFRARIHPQTAAGRLSLQRCQRLVETIRATLQDALLAGGSTLRDFVSPDGQRGYFQQQYYVYGRENEACRLCEKPIKKRVMGQRSTFYCGQCQR